MSDTSTDVTPDELLSSERSHTYQGAGFWRRAAMLVAGETAS